MRKWQMINETGSMFVLKLMALLIRILPHWILVCLAYPVSFFYYIFAPSAVKAIRVYQQRMTSLTGSKMNTWKAFLAFSITLIEKMEGWMGKVRQNSFHLHGDFNEFNSLLRAGRGCILIVSHLGSVEELRSMTASMENKYLGKRIPILSIVDFNVTDNFNKMLEAINPEFKVGLMSIKEISMDSIERISNILMEGGIVIIAGDRSGHRNIKVDFLGQDAEFPYGAFFLTSLLDVPSFFCCCVRSKDICFKSSFEVYIRKNTSLLSDDSRHARKQYAYNSCISYVKTLEEWVMRNPYQWYNFFDFWESEDDRS